MSELSVNAIRFLGIDAINEANSGHPGIVMGAAPMMYSLYTQHLRVNPEVPDWINRDRFVLSAGHGSMLLYALLHLSGFPEMTIEEIKRFRKWQSKTPGHPEVGDTKGVDATSGPLGQGLAQAVGMAQAERYLANRYNKEGFPIFDHYTYVLVGDGCLMEGVSAEASSYAGLQKLDKLIVLYDSNNICLDGSTDDALTEDVRARYESYGWYTDLVDDGTDLAAITEAIHCAKEAGKPAFIEVRTVIGYGAPGIEGTNAAHGTPIGDATKATRQALNWPYAPFDIPDDVYQDFKTSTSDRGKAAYIEWQDIFSHYQEVYPDLAKEVAAIIEGETVGSLALSDFPEMTTGTMQATRNSSQDALNVVATHLPNFFGGSADLAHSNMTIIGEGTLQDSTHPVARNIQFGVREFAMSAILNGMALHGGVRVFGGTFFVFSDYLKGGLRLSALQRVPVTYVFTHDSIAVGEDGPTHEAIEQLAGLRATPHMTVIRPADARETQGAWYYAVTNPDRPTALVLTRQPVVVNEHTTKEGVLKGAYVVYESDNFDRILIASGSEVALAVAAAKELDQEGIKCRVVSMPSMALFDEQDDSYQEAVLPSKIRKRLAIEMAASQPWYQYIGLDGAVIGIDQFGASAKAQDILEAYGFTVEHVMTQARRLS